MFRAGLLPIIRRINNIYKQQLVQSSVMLTGCCQQPVNITLDCLYTVDPPDDEQQAYSKHVESYY